MSVTKQNPLLLEGIEYPLFAEIGHQHVEEAVDRLVATVGQMIVDLESDPDESFNAVYRQLEDISVEIGRVWSPISHLQHVRNSAELRAVYDKVQLRIVELNLRLNQSEIIYRKLFKLSKEPGLTAVQRRIVDLRLRDADLAGISLVGEKRQRFNAINEELTRLSTQFENNALDSLKEFELILTTTEQTAGLPTSFLQLASQSYRLAKKDQESTAETGPWLVTLDYPSFAPFMEYSERRDLREKVYRAWIAIASREPFDNRAVLCDILRLRREQARLLGFDNYADLSVSVKMAGRIERVKQLLSELQVASHDRGKSEYQELVAFARRYGQPLAHWDESYWIRRLEEDRFDLDEEKLRRYFPLPRVLQGTFKLCQILFDVEVREHTSEVQVWHKDVKFYKIYRGGEQIAAFYFDPYSRPQNKLSGAWMGTLTDRRRTHSKLEKPLCYVVCNFTPPVANQPSLLTFWEVITLFHELGHALHGMLTTIDYADISGGGGVEWDAIELPSQFMENFCYLDSVIRDISQHVDSGDPLPIEMLQRLQSKRTFRAASKILRQLFLGQTDLQLHESFDPDSTDNDPFALMRRVAKQILPVPPLESNRFLCSFGHIFAGGYAAGYYSYKWAEVLSADAFSLFRENGLETPEQLRKSGLRYRDTILALGGSMHPDTLYQKFRGRPPTTEALLQECGLSGSGP